LRRSEGVLAWAFRFLQSNREVVVVFSGMSTLEQLQENVRIFVEEQSLNEEEFATFLEIADDMVKKAALPCTTCRYCVGRCPQKLDIPCPLDRLKNRRFSQIEHNQILLCSRLRKCCLVRLITYLAMKISRFF